MILNRWVKRHDYLKILVQNNYDYHNEKAQKVGCPKCWSGDKQQAFMDLFI